MVGNKISEIRVVAYFSLMATLNLQSNNFQRQLESENKKLLTVVVCLLFFLCFLQLGKRMSLTILESLLTWQY